ncbi:MAG: hypothetical protein ABSG85_11700 [Spirochaetia bacterium]|jgi:hypothetical protein
MRPGWTKRFKRLSDLLGIGKPTVRENIVFFATDKDGVKREPLTGEIITEEQFKAARLQIGGGPFMDKEAWDAMMAEDVASGRVEMGGDPQREPAGPRGLKDLPAPSTPPPPVPVPPVAPIASAAPEVMIASPQNPAALPKGKAPGTRPWKRRRGM